ncbi:MAG: hypothetical protein EOP39_17250 [Rubrivivax sp.]|nr:MAG: hypothetical protein EOP39_17250 [Rubrivivax sp.]
MALERSAFSDAYRLRFPRAVSLAEFVEAFYTTRLFRLERAVLTLVGRPSTDADARAMARGEAQRFAAWTVQAREAEELLLQDVTGATCSWFHVERGAGATTLWFGSAVIPRRRGPGGEPRFNAVFHMLLGFHRVYSRALLSAAARRLAR